MNNELDLLNMESESEYVAWNAFNIKCSLRNAVNAAVDDTIDKPILLSTWKQTRIDVIATIRGLVIDEELK